MSRLSFHFNANMSLQLPILHSPFLNFALTKSFGIFFLLKHTVPTTFVQFLTKIKNSFGEEYQLPIYKECPLYSIDFDNSIPTLSHAL